MSDLKIEKRALLFAVAACCLSNGAMAESDAEHHGFRYNGLAIKPYVNLTYRYNSNVDSDKTDTDASSFTVNPGVDLDYTGNNWGLDANGFYSYQWYKTYNELNSERYGEKAKIWFDSDSETWKLVFGESYVRKQEDDSLVDGGRGIYRDSEQLEFSGAFSYELSEYTGIKIGAMYTDLDYKRNGNKYVPLYGWDEWSGEIELSRKLTAKTNFLLAGGMQAYRSDGATRGVNNRSTGYTVMGGIGSRATERITYRAMAGAMFFDYANSDSCNGWTYSLSGNWVITKQLALSVRGSNYYQPSERQMNQASEVYTLSAGLTYRPVRRVSTHFDLAYRREEDQYNTGRYNADREDTVSGRFRVNYQLLRNSVVNADIYGAIEYNNRWADRSEYEFDRYCVHAGLKLYY